jgi:RNA polymerase sigma-70 factor (ECF subfamily)
MRVVAAAMDPSDEDLLQALASGREEAVGPLYARYAPIVFGMAAQALDRPTAEEIVQDVFVAVWKNAAFSRIADPPGPGCSRSRTTGSPTSCDAVAAAEDGRG